MTHIVGGGGGGGSCYLRHYDAFRTKIAISLTPNTHLDVTASEVDGMVRNTEN